MLLAVTWIDLEMIILSQVTQKENNKYHIYHLYVESKMQHKRTYLAKQKLTNMENRLVVAKGAGVVEGWIRSLGL